MKVLEAQVLKPILQVLAIYEARGKLFYKRLNTGPVVRGNFRKGTGRFTRNPATGISDIVIWIKGGPFVCAEIKRPKGRPSPDQLDFRFNVERVGHVYVIWDSVDKALKFLEPHCGPIAA